MMNAMNIMIYRKTAGRFIWLILICHIAFGIAVYPLYAEEPAKTSASEAKDELSSNPQEPEGVKGVAVYYAKRYQGRRTQSGEKLDHNKLTAAHPSLPHGTRVKVVNLANDRSVVVKINDRCRKRSFEIIDLTRAGAQKLGFFGRGSAKVRIIPLPE
jgi:rare lipoprotein A